MDTMKFKSILHQGLFLIWILIVCMCDTYGEDQQDKHDCVVPQGRKAVICLGTDKGSLASWDDFPAHVGDTVYGKCIVSESKKYNMKNIYVKVDPKPCYSQKTGRPTRELSIIKTAIDEQSITFVLQNVSNYDEGFYQCRHESDVLDNTRISTGRTPLKPYVSPTNLEISNWQRVSLRLSPSYRQQIAHIGECQKFNLTWSIKQSLRGSDTFLDCGSSHSMSCSFALNDFRPNMKLFLKVTLKNKVDENVTMIEIDGLNDRVKPASPSNLQIGNESSTSLGLSWDSPNRNFAIFYIIGLSASNVEHKRQLNVTNITEVTVQDLVPHGIYNITLSAKPLGYGLVSDEVYIIHETKADVPGRDPAPIPGGFDETACGKNCRNVTIYWEPLPEQFSNGAIDYIVELNGINQTVDGNRSRHILSLLSKDSPNTVCIYATNKDEEIGRNHSLPGTWIAIPPEDIVSLVSSVTYEEMNETHRLMTWVLNDDDVSVSVVQCRETEEGGCEEEAPLMSSSVVSSGQTFAVTLTGFRTGIGVTKDGKERGIFWSKRALQRAIPYQTNESGILIPIIIGSVICIALIVAVVCAFIFYRRSNRPVNIKRTRAPPSNGWVSAADTEEFIIVDPTVVPPPLEPTDLTTPHHDSSHSSDDISNNTYSDELENNYYSGACGNCPRVGASDLGPTTRYETRAMYSFIVEDESESCGVKRHAIEKQPGGKEEVFVANPRGKVDANSVAADQKATPSLEMEDRRCNNTAIPLTQNYECARPAGEDLGGSKGAGLEGVELVEMPGATRKGNYNGDGLDPHISEPWNMNNGSIASSYNNLAIPHGLGDTPNISTPEKDERSKHLHDYAKVSFAKKL